MKIQWYSFLIGLTITGCINIVCLMVKMQPGKLLELESWYVILFTILAGVASLMED